jgi:ferredoxin
MVIKRIWIDEGCIACNLCEDLSPKVFEVPPGEDCTVVKGYQKHLETEDESIREAVDSCPTEVIKLEEE